MATGSTARSGRALSERKSGPGPAGPRPAGGAGRPTRGAAPPSWPGGSAPRAPTARERVAPARGGRGDPRLPPRRRPGADRAARSRPGCGSGPAPASCPRWPSWRSGRRRSASATGSPARTASCSRCTCRPSRTSRPSSTASSSTARRRARSSSPRRWRRARCCRPADHRAAARAAQVMSRRRTSHAGAEHEHRRPRRQQGDRRPPPSVVSTPGVPPGSDTGVAPRAPASEPAAVPGSTSVTRSIGDHRARRRAAGSRPRGPRPGRVRRRGRARARGCRRARPAYVHISITRTPPPNACARSPAAARPPAGTRSSRRAARPRRPSRRAPRRGRRRTTVSAANVPVSEASRPGPCRATVLTVPQP